MDSRFKFVIPCLIAIVATFVYTSIQEERIVNEVISIPYSELTESQLIELDKFEDDYDPRRSSVSILKHIQGCYDKCIIPMSWNQLVDISNKTVNGTEIISKTNIGKLVIMKDSIDEYEVSMGEELQLIDQVDSISGIIEQYFKDEVSFVEDFKEISLSLNDFNASNYLNVIKNLPNEKQKDYLLGIYERNDVEEYRYFKEGSLIHNKTLNIKGLSHYDLRFYNFKVEPMDRISVLHRIVRAWTNYTRKKQMNTWIAHGSLLGYYFNGLILPWDDDLDVQITVESFWELLKNNGTIVIDYEDEYNPGKYLIDINPWIFKRDSYNPDNKIDARFIDLETGLYIDITVLTINENVSGMDKLDHLELGGKKSIEISKLFEPNYDQVTTELEALGQKINETIEFKLNDKELISCKDYHFYKLEEISPLIPTIFEGEIVLIPKRVKELLMREYRRKSLYLLDYKGFRFDKMKNLWINENKLRYEFNDEIYKFADYHYEFKRTPYFGKNTINLEILKTFKPFRIEPWIRNKFS